MTLDSFTEMAERVRARMIAHLKKAKALPEYIEDCVHESFRLLLPRLSGFHSEDQIIAYLADNLRGHLRDVYRKSKQREQNKREYGYGLDSRRHRPQEFLNWRMDLERATERVAGRQGPNDLKGTPVRYRSQLVRALLVHVYAGVSLDDIAMELATPERSVSTWKGSLVEAKRRLTREMRKGGYGGLR